MRTPTPSSGLLRGLIALALLLTALLTVPALRADPVLPDGFSAQVLTQARLLSPAEPETGSPTPDDPIVRLPYLLATSGSPGKGPSTLSVEFELPPIPATALLGAWITPVCSDPEVRLNGQLLHAPTDLGAASDCQDGVLVPLPGVLLHNGVNRLELVIRGKVLSEVASQERAAVLGPVHIDRLSALLPLQRQQAFWHTSLPGALAAATGLAGLIALLLRRMSRLTYLGYFGATAMGWCGLEFMARGWIKLPWILDALQDVSHEHLVVLGLLPLATATSLFLMRYCGARLRHFDRAIWLPSLIPPVLIALGGAPHLHMMSQSVALLAILGVLGALGLFLVRSWLMARTDFKVMVTALACGGVSALAEWQLNPFENTIWPAHMPISVTLLMLFLGLSLRLIQRLKATIRAGDNQRGQLETRIQEISADMERNYGQMAELRVEQVTARERKRIAADLHDDLGAKLLTIVHTSDNDRIATLAREALEEMRLSVRGLTGKPVQVADAVGDWRSEIKSRLSHGTIELVWVSPDELLMDDRRMSARAYVQTTRILREAVSNLLKHSQASQCRISIRLDSNDFELTISDNGRGIPIELDGRLDRGHGMSTMKGRAKQLQGQCLVESAPGYGTTIRLTLPL
jgi:two-component system, NarL family, sensor histidine kinase UhpB